MTLLSLCPVLCGAAKAILAVAVLLAVVVGVFLLVNPRPPRHP